MTQILVSELLKPPPSATEELLGICLLVAALVAYCAFEYGVARLIAGFVALFRAGDRRDQEQPPDGS